MPAHSARLGTRIYSFHERWFTLSQCNWRARRCAKALANLKTIPCSARPEQTGDLLGRSWWDVLVTTLRAYASRSAGGGVRYETCDRHPLGRSRFAPKSTVWSAIVGRIVDLDAQAAAVRAAQKNKWPLHKLPLAVLFPRMSLTLLIATSVVSYGPMRIYVPAGRNSYYVRFEFEGEAGFRSLDTLKKGEAKERGERLYQNVVTKKWGTRKAPKFITLAKLEESCKAAELDVDQSTKTHNFSYLLAILAPGVRREKVSELTLDVIDGATLDSFKIAQLKRGRKARSINSTIRQTQSVFSKKARAFFRNVKSRCRPR